MTRIFIITLTETFIHLACTASVEFIFQLSVIVSIKSVEEELYILLKYYLHNFSART